MYTFRPLFFDDDQINRYSKLLSLCFPRAKRFKKDYLIWLYRDNPLGKAVGFDAYNGDEIIAHYATIPIQVVDGESKLEGLLSLNTATHPDYQGKGLFTKLANQTYETATNLGKDLVIGVANNNSTPGFVKKLGFDLLSPLDAFLFFWNAHEERADSRFIQIRLASCFAKLAIGFADFKCL